MILNFVQGVFLLASIYESFVDGSLNTAMDTFTIALILNKERL